METLPVNDVLALLASLIAWLKAHPNEVGLLIALIGSLYQIVREKMNARDSIYLLINTLKDEKKLTEAGQFTNATIQKLDKVAEISGVGKAAVTECKEILQAVETKPGLKVFSYNGKPVYLDQLTAVGSRLSAALGVVRGILGR